MVGAGLLPAAVHKGTIYLLFGRENELNDTPGWADFGGGSKPNETPLDVATREGSEELNGLLGSQSQLKKIAIRNKIAELLYHSYTTIVFKTDYDERLEDYYLNNYRFFEKYLPGAKKNPHNGLLEKAEIKWFTFAELRKNRGKFRAFYRNMVDVILEHEAEITSKLLKPVCGPKCSFRVSRSEGTLRSRGPGRSEGTLRSRGHGKKSKQRNLTVKKRQTRRRRRRN
jgi:8-oxo-dGTP pyrophosphatase MutT (NUDIX family)